MHEQSRTTKAARPLALLAVGVLALGLVLGLYATRGTEPAEAYQGNQCSYKITNHRGPEGRLHGVAFKDSWNVQNGSVKQHWHRVSHWTYRGGDWKFNYWDTTRCYHSRPTRVPSDAHEHVSGHGPADHEHGPGHSLAPDSPLLAALERRAAEKQAPRLELGAPPAGEHGHERGHERGHAGSDRLRAPGDGEASRGSAR